MPDLDDGPPAPDSPQPGGRGGGRCRRKNRKFSAEEEAALEEGVHRFGKCWAEIERWAGGRFDRRSQVRLFQELGLRHWVWDPLFGTVPLDGHLLPAAGLKALRERSGALTTRHA